MTDREKPLPPRATTGQRAEAGRRASLRRVWLKAHRWLGLTVGLLFVLIGLTGSVLVFDHAIDEWLHPEILLTRGSGEPHSIEELIAAAETAYAASADTGSADAASDAAPGSAASALSVTAPRVADGVWTVWFASGTEAEPKFIAVHVDPYTARVTGQRVWGEDLLSWIYRLHFRLLAGETGGAIVGFTGILLIVSVITGVILWWPLWKHSWRSALAIRRGARFQYDLHKTVGILSTLVLLVIAWTGVYMEFPEWVKPVVTVFSEETLHPEDLRSARGGAAEPITVDQAVAIAQQRFPHAIFNHLHPPEDAEGVYEIALLQSDEVQSSFGRTQIFIDRFSGKILKVHAPENFTAADAFFAWQFPLHNGEAFGLVGRWIVLISGFTPAVLYVSGFLVWWRKRRSQSRQQARQSALKQPPLAEPAPLASASAEANLTDSTLPNPTPDEPTLHEVGADR